MLRDKTRNVCIYRELEVTPGESKMRENPWDGLGTCNISQ